MSVLVQVFFAWRLGVLTKSWSLVVVICLGSILGGGESTFFFIRATNRAYIDTIFSWRNSSLIETAHTPHFVDFRNFKVSPKFLPQSRIDGPQLVGRDHLACLISDHGPHHNNLPGSVFVSSFSSVCQSGLLMFLILRVSVNATWSLGSYARFIILGYHSSKHTKADLKDPIAW